MILKDYIKAINQLVQEHPEALNMKLVYSIDDEGNAFHEVYHTPTLGFHEDSDFYDVEYMEEDPDVDMRMPNSVCIN